MKYGMGSLFAAAAIATMGMFGAAEAASVNVYNDTDITASANSGGVNGLRGVVNCDVACSVLSYTGGAYSFGSPGELFDGPANSGDAQEAIWVSSILTGTYVKEDFVGYHNTGGDANGGDGKDYTLATKYVVLKVGNNPDYTIVRNDTDSALTFSYTKASGAKGAISHYFGLDSLDTPPTTTPVPLPAGLPLLLSAIGIGAMVTRKRRKSA